MRDRRARGPFCQSCGMPLERPEDFGTDVDGIRINDYCHFCFARGEFTDPDMTMEGMIDWGVEVLDRLGTVQPAQARAMLQDVVPHLKRWREGAQVGAGS